jgi:hypothetical protein
LFFVFMCMFSLLWRCLNRDFVEVEDDSVDDLH